MIYQVKEVWYNVMRNSKWKCAFCWTENEGKVCKKCDRCKRDTDNALRDFSTEEVNRLVKESRLINKHEHALLTLYHRDLYNKYKELADKQFEAVDAGDEVLAAERYTDVLDVISKIDKLEEVARKTGREAGQALVARKIALAEDFSLEALARKARVAQGGKALSADQMAEMRSTRRFLTTLALAVKNFAS